MVNPYVPQMAVIDKLTEESQGERAIKTFRTRFKDKALAESFNFIPGQCAMVTLLGQGECFFAISSSPTRKGYLEFSVMRLGKVTRAMHELELENSLGVRGPYGNGFPVDEWKGKNILCIGGGIGQAPLRSLIDYVIDNKADYGKLDVIYGARTTKDLCFEEELYAMEKLDGVDVHLSIDVEEEGWDRFVGFVPTHVGHLKPDPGNTIAITSGPPIMIKFVIQELEKLGFAPHQIYTTLEMRMKCGIGKCGRCNIGNLYVCKDGPVFSWELLKELKGEV